MTVPLLFATISLALLTQIAIGLGVGLWRRRSSSGGPPALTEMPAPVVPAGAWPGWREFRVVRRAFEDRAQTQCSFYLEPVDGGTLPAFKPGQFLTFQLQLPGGRWGRAKRRTNDHALLFTVGAAGPGELPDHRQARTGAGRANGLAARAVFKPFA